MARKWGVGGNKQGERANLFLTTPTRNVTPQIFETYLVQNNIGFIQKKLFVSNYLSKGY
jgi:hypothetical protein